MQCNVSHICTFNVGRISTAASYDDLLRLATVTLIPGKDLMRASAVDAPTRPAHNDTNLHLHIPGKDLMRAYAVGCTHAACGAATCTICGKKEGAAHALYVPITH